jgi:hypothetical protein
MRFKKLPPEGFGDFARYDGDEKFGSDLLL